MNSILKRKLNHLEWEELVGLEYVLTWGYSRNKEKDEKRHKELTIKQWF